MTEPIVIAGGGIGGLATALALARHGIASRVCERRPEFEEAGAGIQIGPNGTRRLIQLGAADLLAPDIFAPVALDVRTVRDGRTLASLPLGAWIAERHGAPYWTLHRQDLHAALATRARDEPLITIDMATEIAAAADEHDGRLHAITASGARMEAAALVAADGLWSRLRGSMTDDAPLVFTGKSAARAVIPASRAPEAAMTRRVMIWLAPGLHVVHYPVRGGREIALVAVIDEDAETPGWASPCDAAWLARIDRLASNPLRDLLAAAEGWKRWSLFGLKTAPPMAKGRVALLGDAAHPILPFLAQGAVLAIEDAFALAAHLAETRADPQSALKAYAAERQARSARVVRASALNGRIYHLAGLARLARDATLKASPGSVLMQGYDWLYGDRAHSE